MSEYMTYTTEESEKMEVMQLAGKLDGDIELAIEQLAEKVNSNNRPPMYSETTGNNPLGAKTEFALDDIAVMEKPGRCAGCPDL